MIIRANKNSLKRAILPKAITWNCQIMTDALKNDVTVTLRLQLDDDARRGQHLVQLLKKCP